MTGYVDDDNDERKENDEGGNGIDYEDYDNYDDDDDSSSSSSSPNLYSLLNLQLDATKDEVHRAYRTLSTTFHPDKVRLRQLATTQTLSTQTSTTSTSTSTTSTSTSTPNPTTTATATASIEEIQETFLQFKKAHDVLIDPVLRLAYDCYGEDGVELIRKVQQQQREEKTRRDEAAQKNAEGGDGNGNNNDNYRGRDENYDDGDDSDYEDNDNDDDENDAYYLYERLEHLLVVQNNAPRAKQELRKFMDQHDYLQNLLTGDNDDDYDENGNNINKNSNSIHLNLSMTFPPVVPLKPVLYQGRDYLRFVQKNLLTNPPPADLEEKRYFQQKILQEKRLVDYQISQLKSSQKADVGFTLTSVVPPPSSKHNKNINTNPVQHQPNKWSMAMGCSTDLIYPGVTELEAMVAKAAAAKGPKNTSSGSTSTTTKDSQQQSVPIAQQQQQQQKHPVSVFVNTSYQAAPTTQIFGTANLNSDNESHQYSFGSTHTFSNQTACRYGMTILNRSPLPDNDPILFSLKTYRHLQGIGTTSVGVSTASSGKVLQWNAGWQATLSSLSKLFRRSSAQHQQQQQKQQHRFVHKVSAKASVGMLQGNSLELGYKCKFPQNDDEINEYEQKNNSSSFWSWVTENVTLPKRAEITTVWGHFSKVNAMVTHEITSLATHPTLGFGLEHDVSLGRWAWIWEIQYSQSTFRIPISVLQLGSLSNHRAFYSQKFYHGLYCLLLQSMVADLLEDSNHRASTSSYNNNYEAKESSSSLSSRKKGERFPVVKTKAEAERQLALMKPVAENKLYRETQRQSTTGKGFVVLTATYWHRLSHKDDGGDDNNDDDDDPSSLIYEVVSMDATMQLQFWVTNGKLFFPSGIPKSSWMGFYTLATESRYRKGRHRHGRQRRGRQNGKMAAKRWLLSGRRRIKCIWNQLWRTTTTRHGEYNSSILVLDGGDNCDDAGLPRSKDLQQQEGPQLTVRYSYNGNVYEITVGEREELNLPHYCDDDDDHRRVECLGDAAFVQ